MKKLHYLSMIMLLFTMLLVGCQQDEKHPSTNEQATPKTDQAEDEAAQDENSQEGQENVSENKMEEDKNEVVEDEEPIENEQTTTFTEEEIRAIVSDKFNTIATEPLSTGISLYDYVMPALSDEPIAPNATELYENGLDPNSKTYEAADTFFTHIFQDHVTDAAYRMTISHRILLMLNPYNETAFSPVYNHLEVINVEEDTFIIQHSHAKDEYHTLFESTFVLENGHWKYDGSQEVGTLE